MEQKEIRALKCPCQSKLCLEAMKEEDQGECSQDIQNLQAYYGGRGGGGGGLNSILPEVSPIQLPWSLPQVHSFNLTHYHDPFLLHHTQPPPSYSSLFNRRDSTLQFPDDHATSAVDHHHHLRIISNALGPGAAGGGSAPFGLQPDLNKMTTQEIMDAKALAANKSHSAAERRRRERINNHLSRLRSLLPSTTKTDKASLLAEVIQHVKDLKSQTTLIAETSPVPTEMDELTVDAADEDGRLMIKVSLCCDDRADLLTDIIKALKALRLRTLKADIITLGGRVKNVLFITGNDDSSTEQQQPQYSLSSIQEALKAVMEKTSSGDDHSSSGNIKKQRTNINIL